MEIPEQLRGLFSAQLEQRNESYLLEIPKQELTLGDIEQEETYRVAIFPAVTEPETEWERSPSAPPVKESEHREVEIEDIGEQGDGIARVERGFVVIVSDTKQGEKVTVEITDVQDNLAFAEVVDR